MENWLRDIDFLTIRHARSLGQVHPTSYRQIGDFNIPLYDPTGFRQAQELGVFLNGYFQTHPPRGDTLLLSTPYLRGEQTRDGYLSQLTAVSFKSILMRAYLGEHRYGDINGLTDEEIRKKHPSFLAEQAEAQRKGERHLLRFPGIDKDGVAGESQYDVYLRTQAILEDAKMAHDQGVRTIIINTHGTSGRAAQMNLVGDLSSDANWQSWRRPQNCQVDLIRDGQKQGVLFAGFSEPYATRPSLHLPPSASSHDKDPP